MSLPTATATAPPTPQADHLAGPRVVAPLFGATALSSAVRQRTRSLVDEFSGALPPGRVIVVAVETLRQAICREHLGDARGTSDPGRGPGRRAPWGT